MKKFWIIMAVLTAAVFPLFAAEVTTQDILNKLDELQFINQDFTARISIVETESDQGTKTMECIYYARDLADLFLIVMTRPESEKGNGYLKNGKNFWMYRRNTRTFQHVNRDESIAGSNANASDFESIKYAQQYKPVLTKEGKESITPEVIANIPVYRVEVTAKVADVPYPKLVLWVRQDNYLPLREQSFSLSGTLMNTQNYLKWSKIDSHFIPVKQLFIDEFEKGNKSLIEFKEISFVKLDDKIFSKPYLENLSK